MVFEILSRRPSTPNSQRFPVWILGGFLIAVVCLGCGDGKLKTYPVSGQLRFPDGSTPMFGEIEFFNAEHGINARGQVERDGSFTVGTYAEDDGAVAGRHQIVVIQQIGSPLMAGFEGKIEHDHGQLIDTDYLDYRTSGLEFEVEPGGENRIEFTLRPQEKRPGGHQ